MLIGLKLCKNQKLIVNPCLNCKEVWYQYMPINSSFNLVPSIQIVGWTLLSQRLALHDITDVTLLQIT